MADEAKLMDQQNAQRLVGSMVDFIQPRLSDQLEPDELSEIIQTGTDLRTKFEELGEADFRSALRGMDLTDQEIDTFIQNQIKTRREGELAQRAFAEALPTIGGTVGGLIPGPAGLVAAPIGAALGEVGRQVMVDEREPQDIISRMAEEGAFGLAGAGIGRLAGEGLALVGRGTQSLLSRFKKPPETLEALEEAAERLNFPLSPGQTTSIQNIELAERRLRGAEGGPAGLVRKHVIGQKAQESALDKASRFALGESDKISKEVIEEGGKFSKNLFGRELKEKLKEKLERRLEPLKIQFDELRDTFADEALISRGRTETIDAIKDIPEVEAGIGTAAVFGRKLVSLLGNKTANHAQIQKIRSAINTRIKVARPDEAQGLLSVKTLLDKFDEDSLIETLVQKRGIEAASDIINSRRAVRKEFAEFAKELSQLDPIFKTVGPSEAVAKVEKISADKLANTFLKSENLDFLEKFAQTFPSEFGLFQQAKAFDVFSRVTNSEGKIDFAMLNGIIEKMDPAIVKAVFGSEKAQTLRDVALLSESIRKSEPINIASGFFSRLKESFNFAAATQGLRFAEGAARRAEDIGNSRAFKAISGQLFVSPLQILSRHRDKIMDFKTADLVEIPPQFRSVMHSKIMADPLLSSTEKAKRINVLNKFGAVQFEDEAEMTAEQVEQLRDAITDIESPVQEEPPMMPVAPVNLDEQMLLEEELAAIGQ